MEIVKEIKLVPVMEIRPYHRNVRIHEKTVEELVKVIPYVGFNVPLLLTRSNVIVKGHARWKAAIQLGLERVPCVYTDSDEELIKLDRLTDNKIQELSDWDDEMLPSELASLNLDFEFDLSALGFNLSLPSAIETEKLESESITDEDVRKTVPMNMDEYEKVICSKCGNQMFIKKE
jgi:ParB-like chromosome segregation protein Spo0J